MILFDHRRNTIERLRETPANYGVEVDIRSYGNKLIIHHDPYEKGVLFSEWIQSYHHSGLILNVKEEGLEAKLIEVMKTQGITNYFFLDQSFPFLVKWANLGETKCAVRFSEYESIDTALTLSGKIEWVWVDCFTKFPLRKKEADQLTTAGFKLCLVSPELQGRSAENEIPELAKCLISEGITPEAVCTKAPAIWEKEYPTIK